MCMIAHHTNNRPSCHSVAFFVKDRRGKYLYDEQSYKYSPLLSFSSFFVTDRRGEYLYDEQSYKYLPLLSFSSFFVKIKILKDRRGKNLYDHSSYKYSPLLSLLVRAFLVKDQVVES